MAAAGGVLTLLAATAAATGTASARPAFACSNGWDATVDYSVTTNPGPDNCIGGPYSNVWSYRAGPSSTGPTSLVGTSSVGSLSFWVGQALFAKNTTPTPMGIFPANTVVMIPNVVNVAQIRWVAPIAVKVCVTVSAWDTDAQGGDGVRVSLRHTGSGPLLWSATIPNGGGPQSFTVPANHHLGFNAGQGLNLTVDPGAANDAQYDATGITETIIPC